MTVLRLVTSLVLRVTADALLALGDWADRASRWLRGAQ